MRGESEALPSSAAASMPSASIPTAAAAGGRKSPVGHMVAELGWLLADLRGRDEEIEEDGAPLEELFMIMRRPTRGFSRMACRSLTPAK
jgi:hypothetical protein